MPCVNLLCALALVLPGAGIRTRYDVRARAISAGVVGGGGSRALGGRRVGQLEGRRFGSYRLVSELSSTPIGRARDARSMIEQSSDLVPGEKYKNPRSHLDLKSILGTGSFGVTYLAERTRCKKCKHKHELVAVKFVYTKKSEKIYLATARDAKDKDLKEAMDDMVRECRTIQSLQAKRLEDVQGASRLISCQKACCTTCKHCKIPPRVPPYIVMDYAGEDGEVWFEKHISDKKAFADVLNQVMQGVNYMRKLEPPVIHHDLKYANIAVMESRRRVIRHAKLIDLGAAIRATHNSSREATVVTEWYEPPESHIGGYAYVSPAYAYDMWSVGIMALEGLCGLEGDKEMTKLQNAGYKEYNRTHIHMLTSVLDSLKLSESDSKCAHSMAPLIHPDPEKRPLPRLVHFTEHGLEILQDKKGKHADDAHPHKRRNAQHKR